MYYQGFTRQQVAAKKELTMVVKAAIIEDDAAQASILQEYLLSLKKGGLSFELSVFRSAEDFLAVFSPGAFQIIFMDIQLPRMDGISAAGRVRITGDDVVIVFITSAPQFAIHGYEVNAKDYILKPLIYDSFVRKMDRLLSSIKRPPERLISISANGTDPQMISAESLIFVEVFGHKLIYHCKDKDIEVYGKISDAEEMLKSYNFLRCNRNAVINPRFIDHIQGNVIRMGEHELIISSPRKKEFLKELNDWIAR